MFGTQHFVLFLLSGIALNLTPGQDTRYIIGRSLAQGRTAGIVSVLGIGTGGVIHVIAATIGLYSLLALSLSFFQQYVSWTQSISCTWELLLGSVKNMSHLTSGSAIHRRGGGRYIAKE